MSDVAPIREQIDRQIRPGQPGGATGVNRLPTAPLLGATKTTVANRYDWDDETNHRYGLYGRSRYGVVRYLGVS